ncbi:MAG: hypothetical protein LBG61_00500 [Burkholderiales bacterium]|jgi:hypothetical protein|nr:hypothetical protein [Burkholderiales bacterium]
MKIPHKKYTVKHKRSGFFIPAVVLIAAAFLSAFSLFMAPAFEHYPWANITQKDGMMALFFMATLVETVGILVLVLTDNKPWHRTLPKIHMCFLMLILGASLLCYLVLPGVRFQEESIWAACYYSGAFVLLLYIFIGSAWFKPRRRVPVFSAGTLTKLNTITLSGR